MQGDMAHDVFISYPPADKAVADAVCARLDASGVACRLAPRDLTPVSEWNQTVDALDQSRVVVWIFRGDESVSNAPEVERAVREGIHVVSFRLQDGISAQTLKQHVARAANSVRALLG